MWFFIAAQMHYGDVVVQVWAGNQGSTSSAVRASVLWAEGRGFEPRVEQMSKEKKSLQLESLQSELCIHFWV